MSGLSAEAEDASKRKPSIYELKAQIEKALPEETIHLEEKYLYDVLKGHRLRVKTYAKNKHTNKITDLDVQYFKIPKHVPTWITKHDLWHHTKEEIDALTHLMKLNQEQSPSKNTRNTWLQILKENVRKTNNNKKQIPIPNIR